MHPANLFKVDEVRPQVLCGDEGVVDGGGVNGHRPLPVMPGRACVGTRRVIHHRNIGVQGSGHDGFHLQQAACSPH